MHNLFEALEKVEKNLLLVLKPYFNKFFFVFLKKELNFNNIYLFTELLAAPITPTTLRL